jgi:Holliday junction resolvase RusA-like endonuclease
MEELSITIPGEPHAQGRARATVIGGHARMYDPQNSREWKAVAQHHMRLALDGHVPLVGPVELTVVASFTCPKGDWRTKSPRPRRRHAKKPDADNVLKAVKDAATGVLWLDDCQVCVVRVEKWIAAQGDPPGIELTVAAIGEV